MKVLFFIIYFLTLLLFKAKAQQEKQDLAEKLKTKDILYIQQVCMTFSEHQCKQFNYENYINRKPIQEQAEELNEMAKYLKHMNPLFKFKAFDNSTISLVPTDDLPNDTYIFKCNTIICLTNEFNPKQFYNYNEMKNDFKEYQKLLKNFELEREIQLALNLLLHMENINNSMLPFSNSVSILFTHRFSLYLPHIPSTMNVPLFSFGLAEIQKLMEKRMEVQQLWYKFQNLTSNYTAKQTKSIFGFKEERLVDFADFSWALLHIFKYSLNYEGKLYIIPGIEFVRQTNNYLKKLYHQTEWNNDYSIFSTDHKKEKPLVQHYSNSFQAKFLKQDPEYYFIYNREINHNHPQQCVYLQIVNENQIGQCMEDILFYADIKKGKICVRKDKEFVQQVDVLISVINLKRSFSCKCRDDIRETVYKNPQINLIDSLQIIKDKCLSGQHNNPKNYSKDIRPQFQSVLDVQKKEYDSYINNKFIHCNLTNQKKLSSEEYVLKHLQGIYIDNLDLLLKYVYYKRKSLSILERSIKRAYAASDQYKFSLKNEKNKKNEFQDNKDESLLSNDDDEKEDL